MHQLAAYFLAPLDLQPASTSAPLPIHSKFHLTSIQMEMRYRSAEEVSWVSPARQRSAWRAMPQTNWLRILALDRCKQSGEGGY